MKRFLFLISFLFLAGCSNGNASEPVITEPAYTQTAPVFPEPAPEEPFFQDPLEERIAAMTLEERVGQLFLARCDASVATDHLEKYHLGGFVLFGTDFQGQTPQTVRNKLDAYQSAAKIPLLIAVDEEGGTVTRISRYSAFRSQPFSSPRYLFENQGYQAVLDSEEEKCRLLSSLGINVNLGPVCDITTDLDAFMYLRSLGQSPSVTGRFVMDTVALMEQHRIGSVLKHFPGYGNNPDTHTGIARDGRNLNELEAMDLIPFQAGIRSGCDAILISHTIAEAWDTEYPASLSPAVHQYLRQDLGFEGVIITDDLVMEAITDRYGTGEAAVMAVLAGNDLLCSTDYVLQYEAVLAAVLDGRIHLRVLNAAVRNVLEWKTELGLIQ